MYLKHPICFTDVLTKPKLTTVDLRESVEQHIKLMLKVVPGELAQDRSYGGKVKHFNLKPEDIHHAKQAYEVRIASILARYEKRLQEVKVSLIDSNEDQQTVLKIKGELSDGRAYTFSAPVTLQ